MICILPAVCIIINLDMHTFKSEKRYWFYINAPTLLENQFLPLIKDMIFSSADPYALISDSSNNFFPFSSNSFTSSAILTLNCPKTFIFFLLASVTSGILSDRTYFLIEPTHPTLYSISLSP